eukprot:770684_1
MNELVVRGNDPKMAQIKDQQPVKISPWMKRIWTKYSSIENKNTRVLESFHQYGLDSKDIDWCITEKVHGANFAILYNGKEFGAATYVRIHLHLSLHHTK